MSAQDGQNHAPLAGGTMSDHLKKYRSYIDELKQGRSSGISAAFGRASDLLPPEVMTIKAEPVDLVKDLIALDSKVLADDFDREFLRKSVESLVEAYAQDLDDPVGSVVQTDDGVQDVLSVYVENGVRMFMLSDLSTIDETTFRRTLVAEPKISVRPAAVQTMTTSTTAAVPQDLAAHESFLAASEDFEPDAVEEPKVSSAAPPESLIQSFTQSVTTIDGLPLWEVYYSADGPELVSMSDGGIIKRAEGREEYIFSRLSQIDGDIKFYILSGFVVDPSTGNVYFEANQGAYTAAFLNNGWTIHQYLSAQGDESFFVTEPVRIDRAPITMRVKKLDLDLTTGEVTYETMDSAAIINLKSRKL